MKEVLAARRLAAALAEWQPIRYYPFALCLILGTAGLLLMAALQPSH